MSNGKATYKLMGNIRTEQDELSEAVRKRGFAANVGMGVGGFLGMLGTGGAATPFIAALKSGLGTGAFGKLGDVLAKQKYKIKGGRFFQEERENLLSQLGQKIGAGAIKAGLFAGTTAFKGIEKVEKGIGDIFKAQPDSYWKDLLEGGQSLFDFKRSPLSRFFNPNK